MKKRYRMRWILTCAILGTVCGAQIGCAEEESVSQDTPQSQAGSAVDSALPALETAAGLEADPLPEHLQVVVLDDIKKMIAEAAAADQVLVIDFWATWCVPCVAMFPDLHAGLAGYGDRVRGVSVTVDDPSREASAIEFLAAQHALEDAYIFKSDSEAQQALVDGLGERWNNLAVPAILVYDPDRGLVGEFLEGGDVPKIIELLNTLLASDQEAQP